MSGNLAGLLVIIFGVLIFVIGMRGSHRTLSSTLFGTDIFAKPFAGSELPQTKAPGPNNSCDPGYVFVPIGGGTTGTCVKV